MPPKGSKKSASANKTTTTTSSTPQQNPKNKNNTPKPPNWPPLKPLVPASDLYLETLLDDQIIIIRNLLTSTLCKTYVNFLSSLPLVTTPSRPKKGEAVRVNDRFQVHDPVFAERLWGETGLKGLVSDVGNEGGEAKGVGLWGGEVLGLNPNIRIYRYGAGQFFDKHYDDSVPLSPPNIPPFQPSQKTTRARTTWTLLIYLTTCQGGETVFYSEPEPSASSKKKTAAAATPDPIVVGLETGMALLHRHGERCLLHEGREVVGGEKWVVRSDLVVGV
ncbi:hypothetical protein AJ79_03307 [Helicocarpus griseus UAMH5409]|uniref:Prolyl 4-hydroxylase alpha subunit domain-containing protein n=1 Tax=Helicocarpus griseus UAMH5409 TaxID=1447875 RepID=A0A2B7XZY7_9EURO|nr:hypothetical protein AJ79_03307 [Helicocarpus griseus UAMH5409]